MKTKAITTIMLTLFLASTLSMAFTIAPAAALSSDLVGLWHFDTVNTGVTPNTTPDDSGHENIGYLYPGGSGLTLVDGKYGKALSFDGVKDYVSVSFSSSLDFTAAGQDFSLEAWINVASGGAIDVIGSQEDSSGTGRYWLRVNSDNSLESNIGNKVTTTATGVITRGSWQYVALTFDKVDGSQSGTLKIYVDGVEEKFATRTFETSEGNYRIGIGKTGGNPFKGLIDEVRIWNKVLSAGVIAYHYSLGDVSIDIKPGSYPNSINPDSNGVVPVAILGSADFDVAEVNPLTVTLAGAAVKFKGKSGNAGSIGDVNGDGYPDLVVQVYTNQLTALGDTIAVLNADTYGGLPLTGSDSIRIVPPET